MHQILHITLTTNSSSCCEISLKCMNYKPDPVVNVDIRQPISNQIMEEREIQETT